MSDVSELFKVSLTSKMWSLCLADLEPKAGSAGKRKLDAVRDPSEFIFSWSSMILALPETKINK